MNRPSLPWECYRDVLKDSKNERIYIESRQVKIDMDRSVMSRFEYFIILAVSEAEICLIILCCENSGNSDFLEIGYRLMRRR